jgi:hypothetical protein
MRGVGRQVALVAAAITTMILFAGSSIAHADQDDDPCSLAVTFLCRFMPIAPELDGDVDLTQPQPGTGPVAPLPQPPPDPAVGTSTCMTDCS